MIGFKFCPKCDAMCCPPSGHSKDLLIIGEFPSDEEVRQRRPFASNSNFISAGKIFRKELERVGLSLNDFRVTNLWHHIPNKDEECYEMGYKLVLEEAKGKQAILLVGSEVVEAFTTFKVSDVSGLKVDSAILSAPLIVAMVNPALAQHRAVGEVRFAITKWKEYLEEAGLV